MTKRRPTAVLRADADSRLGIGHLRRSLVLLRQLGANGFQARVVTETPLSPEISPLLGDVASASLPVPAQDESEDAEETLALIGRAVAGGSWVIVDHYWLGERWERRIRDAGYRVLAIDDFRDRRHHADVLVGDSDAPFDPALNSAPVAPLALAGPAYALIGPEYAAETAGAAPEGPKRLLLCYGGGDPTGETRKALEALRLLRGRGAALGPIHMVLGPANPRRDELRRLAATEGIAVHAAPPSLAPLLREADLFLTAGGNAMVEALAMRKPCVVTRTSANQRLMTEQLARREAIVLAGDHAAVGPEELAEVVASSLRDYERLSARAREAAVFDHLGASRICEALRALSPEARP